ncbi:unnamed protein product [Paramecium octaurelia]|uniref:Uncharacterized protein n=1 Tax=Paramecium octaurelia TaxID=43137 RepID=A0A8S1XMF6_PAROT|nr:unnamed protein product [Paramecium octaurelia]
MNENRKIRITELSTLNLILCLKEKKQIINTLSFSIFTSKKNVYEIKVQQQMSNDQLFQGQVQLTENTIDHIFLNFKDLSIKQHNVISVFIPIDKEQMITNDEVVLKLNENSIERILQTQNTFELNQRLDNILGIQSQFRGRLTARKGIEHPVEDETIKLKEVQLKVEEQLKSQISEIEKTEQQLQEFKEFFNNSNQSQEQQKTSLINCLVQHDQAIMNILQAQWKNSENVSFKIESSLDKYTNQIVALINEIKKNDEEIQKLQFNFKKQKIYLECTDQILERLTYKINYLQQINPLVVKKLALLQRMNQEIVTCEKYIRQNYHQNEINKEQLQTIQNLKTLSLEAFEKTNHFLEILNFNNDLKLQQQIEIFKKQEYENQINKTKLEQKIQSLQIELEKQKNRAKNLENKLQTLYQQIEQIKVQNKHLQQINSQHQNEFDQSQLHLKQAEDEVASLKYLLQSLKDDQIKKYQNIINDNSINNLKFEQTIKLLQDQLEKQKNKEKENTIIKTKLEQTIKLQQDELEKQKNKENENTTIKTKLEQTIKLQQDELEKQKNKEKENTTIKTKLEQTIKLQQDELEKQKNKEKENTIIKTKLEQTIKLQQDELEKQKNKENENTTIKTKLEQTIKLQQDELEKQKNKEKENTTIKTKLEQTIKLQQDELEKQKNKEKENTIIKTKLEQTIKLQQDELEKQKNKENENTTIKTKLEQTIKLQQDELEKQKNKEKENTTIKTKLEQTIKLQQDELEKQKNKEKENTIIKTKLEQTIKLQQDELEKQKNKENENTTIKTKLEQTIKLQQDELEKQKNKEKENTTIKTKLEQTIKLQQDELEKQKNKEKENTIIKTKLEQQIQSLQIELEKSTNRAKNLESKLQTLQQQIGQIETQNKQLLHINQNNQDKLIFTQNDVDQSKQKLKVAEDEVVSLRLQLYSQQEQKFGDPKQGKISKIEYHFNNYRLNMYDHVINQKEFSIFSFNVVRKSLSGKSYFGICDKNITNAEFVQFLSDKEQLQQQIYILFSLEGERLNNFQEVISQICPITKFLSGQTAAVIFDPSISTFTIYKSLNELEIFGFSLPSTEKQFVPCFIHSDFDEIKQITPQYINFEI